MRYLEIIAEEDDLLVVNKPAGLVCHPTKAGPLSSLISRARLHLGEQVIPHLIHRLDRETGGVLALATSEAAGVGLRYLWMAGLISKEYCAIVHGEFPAGDRWLDAPLGKDLMSRVAIRDWVVPVGSGSEAMTHVRRWCVFERDGQTFSLLRVWLHTGRKHQIRIHLAHAGFPIVGDKIYGPSEEYYLAFVERRVPEAAKDRLLLPNHALHAARLWIPWQGTEREYIAPPSAVFTSFLRGQPIPWVEDDGSGVGFE
jgi:23S rRNA pseudouridine1911/1915/1917 synthase